MLLLRISAIFHVVSSFGLLFAFALPDNDIFSKWSVLLESRLSDLIIAVTHIDSARMLYKPDSSIDLYKIDGEKILKQVLEKMTDLWQRKKTALRRLVNKAEKSVIFYKRNYGSLMLTQDDVEFFNVKAVSPTVRLNFSPRFRQKVSFKQSGVHIPLEVYDGYPEVLNGLNWSSSLDDVFKENWKQDPTLRWQYFGSYYGFMRIYPSFRWPDHPSLPDLFDVRRRTWYIQGSISPKDVVILIDRSGSVHGQTLDIMKITVRALLNSLGENDYVNVAWFNNKVNWVIPCLDTLIQATAQIRRLLSDAVERLTESNLTSYTAALDFAFDAFRKFDENKKPWSGSNCHKIIMFLSDGGTEWPSELVTKHCNESRNGQIRIFTFACGPHPIPTVVLKEMACSTGGYFSPITALGSVRVKVQDYVRVLSRPLALSEDEDEDLFQWHNFYRDIGGLGMMTTVTLPVFNRVSNSSKENHLLGVMGIDVPIDEMTDLFPKHQLGLFGYPFAINTNGFVIFHPRLQDHIVYIEDPPDVDLSDLEGVSEEIYQMRKNMVDGKRGSLKKYTSIIPVGLGHAIPVEMDYFYDSIESSTFRFGLALPSGHTAAKVKLTEEGVTLATRSLSQMETTILAPWRFCPIGEADEELTTHQLADRISNNYTTCVPDLVHHLLWDVEKAKVIQGKWKENTLPGIWTRFLMTSSGLTTIQTAGFVEDYLRQRDPLRNNLYKRAAHKAGCVLSVAKGRSQEVTAACRIMLNDSFIAAVIGVEMEQAQIQSIFDEVTGIDGNDVSCRSSNSLFCYLLNDGGVVIASNQVHVKAGDFIGIHDPEMLGSLIAGGMLKSEYRYNYLSWCSKETYQVVTQSATRPIALLSFFYHIVSIFNWNVFYNFLLHLISSLGKVESKVIVNDSGNHSCVTRSTWYYHAGSTSHSGAFACDSRQRNFRSVFLPNASLIFVVAEPPCDNADSPQPQGLDPQEDIGPFHCSRDEMYRRRQYKCYSEMPKDREDCGADSGSYKVLAGKLIFLINTVNSLRFII
ncbi:UNVERIFIED_CONTAM: hypothetical protein PYX00_006895 [Menopon gallinae]|uniref:VWFA domain-containing protein n=1 Tax=Menopon gallinae TaxID=328185 RepID=A0AAW2HX83_9NEOP